MSRLFRVVAFGTLLVAGGCAGEWMQYRPSPTREAARPPRDLRVTLENDSTIVLRNARIRNDSVVGEIRSRSETRPAGMPLDSVRRIEAWHSAAEQTTGGVLVSAVIAAALLLALLAYSLPAS
jgi:hypothetical protein